MAEVHHSNGKVSGVSLNSGERIKVETLLWIPPSKTSPLLEKLVMNFELGLDESGHVKTDGMQRTNITGLWAAGEVTHCCSSGLEAAAAGSRAAFEIIRNWYQ